MELQPSFREEHRLLLPGRFIRRRDRQRRLRLVPVRAGDRWISFQEVFQHTEDFAVAHGKPWMAVEYGVQEDLPFRDARRNGSPTRYRRSSHGLC